MSFNAKNLSYESNEPAFLRRLRSEHEIRDSSRHERPLARPRKQAQEGEQDDEPTYVVEDSQDTLSKAEYEALIATKDDENQKENTMPSSTEARHGIEEAKIRNDENTREAALVKQQFAGIGCSTKRRLAKIVGDEEIEEREAAPQTKSLRNKDKKLGAKKLKLSFDEGTEA